MSLCSHLFHQPSTHVTLWRRGHSCQVLCVPAVFSLSSAVHKCCCSACLPQASSVCIGLCFSPPSPFPENFGSISSPWLMSICNSLSSFHQCFTLPLCGPHIPSPSQVLEASLELSVPKNSLTHPSSAFLKKT